MPGGGIGIATGRLIGRRDQGGSEAAGCRDNLLGWRRGRFPQTPLVDRFAKRVVFDAQFFGHFAAAVTEVQ